MTAVNLSMTIGAGVGVLFVSGRFAAFILNRIAPWDGVKPPTGVETAQWQAILRGSGAGAATWLGGLESLLAYLATVAYSEDAATIIGGWMAFKVASKWESWANVVQVPDILTESNVSPLEFLRARRQWGALLYTRFLCGTLLNILTGALVGILVRQAIVAVAAVK